MSSVVEARGCSGILPSLQILHLNHSVLSMLVSSAIVVSRVKP